MCGWWGAVYIEGESGRGCVVDCLIARSIDWLIDWRIRQIDWLIDGLSGWLIDPSELHSIFLLLTLFSFFVFLGISSFTVRGDHSRGWESFWRHLPRRRCMSLDHPVISERHRPNSRTDRINLHNQKCSKLAMKNHRVFTFIGDRKYQWTEIK